MAATGNKDYGYFGGGSDSNVKSILERIEYANDLAALIPKGTINDNRTRLGATGNKDYGYFGGGGASAPPGVRTSYIDRIDYSNDTNTVLVSRLTHEVYAASGSSAAANGLPQ